MIAEPRMHAIAVARNQFGPIRAYVSSFNSDQSALQRFIILTSGRAGSELLVSLLSSHPLIACDSELLSERRLAPDRLLQGRIARAQRRGMSAYGIKVQPKHIFEVQRFANAGGWVRSLSANGWKVIRLCRANRLHQAISAMNGRADRWHFPKGAGHSFTPSTLNPYELMGNMCAIAFYESQIDRLLEDVEFLDVTYETDLQQPEDQDRTVENICRLLGLQPEPTVTHLERLTPINTRDMVANYDEIAQAFRQNQFSDFLED
jgi:LPS sulfotransferase NodH